MNKFIDERARLLGSWGRMNHLCVSTCEAIKALALKGWSARRIVRCQRAVKTSQSRAVANQPESEVNKFIAERARLLGSWGRMNHLCVSSCEAIKALALKGWSGRRIIRELAVNRETVADTWGPQYQPFRPPAPALVAAVSARFTWPRSPWLSRKASRLNGSIRIWSQATPLPGAIRRSNASSTAAAPARSFLSDVGRVSPARKPRPILVRVSAGGQNQPESEVNKFIAEGARLLGE